MWQKNKGSNFIEIMISLILISLMLLGLDMLHLQTIRYMKINHYANTALGQIKNIFEQLEANSNLEIIIDKWNKENQLLLPSGRGTIMGHYPDITATIYWGNMDNSVCYQHKIGLSGCLAVSL